MKKLVILSLLLIVIAGLCGCTSGCSFTLASVENNTSHKMSASYKLLSGTREKEITVKEGETLTISADITTTKGSLDVSICDENGESLYDEKDLQTTTFTVPLTEPGKYTLTIKASKHKGSYSFSW